MPDVPGQMGNVATAIGAIGVSIEALEVIQRGSGYVTVDLMLSKPRTMLPDTVVSACTALSKVNVVWVSRYPESWGLESDIEMMDRILESPTTGAETLTHGAPTVFHCHWALLLNRQGQTLEATSLAPDICSEHVAMLGDLTQAHTVELADGWLEYWGSVVCALAPLGKERTLVLGRQGGPAWLPTEQARLRLLSTVVSQAQELTS